jgi:endonuclease III
LHNSTNGPQTVFLPEVEYQSLEQILWLFFSTLTDRRQISIEVYKAHQKLHRESPWLYTEKVLQITEEELVEILVKHKIGVPRQSAKYWLRCAKTLFEEFDGNPISIVKHCNGTVDGIQAWKLSSEKETGTDPLPGYGPKISSLFLLYLAEIEVYPMPVDAYPVDVHVQRLYLQYDAVRFKAGINNDTLETYLRPEICRVILEHNLDKVSVAHAFWQKGSKCCSGCSRRPDITLLCSIASDCKGPANTKSYFAEGVWHTPIDFMRRGSDRTFKLESGPLFAQMPTSE